MHPRSIGFIGKTNITPEEETLLKELGRSFALSTYPTVLIPQKGACEAVRLGVLVEEGELITVTKDTSSQSAHCFIYADDRLMGRLKTVIPDLETNPKILLSMTPEGILEWLSAARIVLKDRGIEFV